MSQTGGIRVKTGTMAIWIRAAGMAIVRGTTAILPAGIRPFFRLVLKKKNLEQIKNKLRRGETRTESKSHTNFCNGGLRQNAKITTISGKEWGKCWGKSSPNGNWRFWRAGKCGGREWAECHLRGRERAVRLNGRRGAWIYRRNAKRATRAAFSKHPYRLLFNHEQTRRTESRFETKKGDPKAAHSLPHFTV